MPKVKLPILTEVSIKEAQIERGNLAKNYEIRLRATSENNPITCQKGCAHCCYHPVVITILEGISIYRWLFDNHLWSHDLKEKFLRTSEQTLDLSFQVWLLSMIPCPLLDNGTCVAYESRPFACRITYSIGDPHFCHPHRIGPQTGIVPKKQDFKSLEKVEAKIMARHHLQHFRIPLASAVLFGERIVQGELELEDCQRALWREYFG